jgi:hypothetical protein
LPALGAEIVARVLARRPMFSPFAGLAPQNYEPPAGDR